MRNKSMIVRTLVFVLASVLLTVFTTPVLAESKKAPAKGKTVTQKQEEPPKTMEEFTCDDFIYLLGDTKKVTEATYLMFWAYGVRTGVQGVDPKKTPFDLKGFEAFTKDLIKSCKDNSDAKFLTMVTATKEGPK